MERIVFLNDILHMYIAFIIPKLLIQLHSYLNTPRRSRWNSNVVLAHNSKTYPARPDFFELEQELYRTGQYKIDKNCGCVAVALRLRCV